jgi:hypothetical protein
MTLPSTATTKFAAGLFGLGVRGGLGLLVENNLHNAGAIAHVEEEEIAEVAALGDPAHDDGVAVGIGGPKGATVVCAFEIAEKIEHVVRPFLVHFMEQFE